MTTDHTTRILSAFTQFVNEVRSAFVDRTEEAITDALSGDHIPGRVLEGELDALSTAVCRIVENLQRDHNMRRIASDATSNMFHALVPGLYHLNALADEAEVGYDEYHAEYARVEATLGE